MDPVTIGFISGIFELVLKYGVPGALEIVRAWDVENPTLEDIEALKKKVPRPETYFEPSEDAP